MMFRVISGALVMYLICSAAFAEELRGFVIRPRKVDAKVKGCQVSEPGTYQATTGSLIELEYVFPVTPLTVPKVVDREWDKGAIHGSDLGIRNLIVPRLVGTGTYAFYFEAKHAGSGTAIVVIDKTKYTYVFEVAEGQQKKPQE
jgi:hypothetical protein